MSLLYPQHQVRERISDYNINSPGTNFNFTGLDLLASTAAMITKTPELLYAQYVSPVLEKALVLPKVVNAKQKCIKLLDTFNDNLTSPGKIKTIALKQ